MAVLKHVDQRYEDARTGSAQWVPQRNRTAVHVGLVGANTHEVHVDQAHDAKGFVELKKVDVSHADSGALGGQRNGFGRSRREPLGLVGGVGRSRDSGEGLET